MSLKHSSQTCSACVLLRRLPKNCQQGSRRLRCQCQSTLYFSGQGSPIAPRHSTAWEYEQHH